jgi:hypothetical protein
MLIFKMHMAQMEVFALILSDIGDVVLRNVETLA